MKLFLILFLLLFLFLLRQKEKKQVSIPAPQGKVLKPPIAPSQRKPIIEEKPEVVVLESQASFVRQPKPRSRLAKMIIAKEILERRDQFAYLRVVDQQQEQEPLSKTLGLVLTLSRDEKMTLGIFIDKIGSKAQALLALVFSVPFLVFVSLPGISTIFGLCILFLGVRLALGKGIWIPKRFKEVTIGGERFYKIFGVVCKIVLWMEKLTRPRLSWVFSWSKSNMLQGILLAINGLCLALPLPPGTNLPPTIAAVTLSLGMLEKDGLWVLLGYFFFAVNIAFFLAIFWYGKELISFFLPSS